RPLPRRAAARAQRQPSARDRRPGPRRPRARRLRRADLAARRRRRQLPRRLGRRPDRPRRRLLRGRSRHLSVALHGRDPVVSVPAVRDRTRLDRRPQPRRGDRRDRVLQLGVGRPHRPRPDALDQGEGIRRGGAVARRGRPADHVRRHPPEPARPGARLPDAADPGCDRVRGDALVPRPRRRAADADVGEHDRRRAQVLPGRLVVPARAGRCAARHDALVQPARGQRPRRARPPRGEAVPPPVTRFLVRRVLLGLVVLWALVSVVFVMFFVAPHDVARLIAGRQASPDTVAAVKRRLGLDRPVLDQYGTYLGHLVKGNLGYSFYNSSSVRSLIWARVPVTFSLAIGGAVLWLLIGVASGVIAATRPRSWRDRAVTVFALVFYSMPAFLLGVIFLYFLFFRLHLAGI